MVNKIFMLAIELTGFEAKAECSIPLSNDHEKNWLEAVTVLVFR